MRCWEPTDGPNTSLGCVDPYGTKHVLHARQKAIREACDPEWNISVDQKFRITLLGTLGTPPRRFRFQNLDASQRQLLLEPSRSRCLLFKTTGWCGSGFVTVHTLLRTAWWAYYMPMSPSKLSRSGPIRSGMLGLLRWHASAVCHHVSRLRRSTFRCGLTQPGRRCSCHSQSAVLTAASTLQRDSPVRMLDPPPWWSTPGLLGMSVITARAYGRPVDLLEHFRD